MLDENQLFITLYKDELFGCYLRIENNEVTGLYLSEIKKEISEFKCNPDLFQESSSSMLLLPYSTQNNCIETTLGFSIDKKQITKIDIDKPDLTEINLRLQIKGFEQLKQIFQTLYRRLYPSGSYDLEGIDFEALGLTRDLSVRSGATTPHLSIVRQLSETSDVFTKPEPDKKITAPQLISPSLFIQVMAHPRTKQIGLIVFFLGLVTMAVAISSFTSGGAILTALGTIGVIGMGCGGIGMASLGAAPWFFKPLSPLKANLSDRKFKENAARSTSVDFAALTEFGSP